jgi:hypothetical protein
VSDAIREAFEKFYRKSVDVDANFNRNDNLQYRSAYVQYAWVVWQAALQSGEAVTLWSLRQLAHEHDGKFHGPNVEHLSIPEHSLLGFASAIIAKHTAPQPVVDVNQKLVADKYEKLEPALEALVDLCNNLNIGTYDEVIAAEAALERLYLARKALLSAGKGGES